jgi:predicted SnoaL-like aldol condensation-catalyzing enzyme
MSVKSTLKGKAMSETNKANTVAFHKKAVFEGDVDNAFRTHAGSPYRQHNPLIEDGMDGLRKFVASMRANRPDAHGEIKRVFADGDYVMLHSHWHGLSDSPRGEAVVDIYRLEDGKGARASRSRRRLLITTRCSDLLTTTVAAILESNPLPFLGHIDQWDRTR